MPASSRRRALALTTSIFLFAALGLATTVTLSWLLTRQARFSVEWTMWSNRALGHYKFGSPERWTLIDHFEFLGTEEFSCTAHWLRPATMAVPADTTSSYPCLLYTSPSPRDS